MGGVEGVVKATSAAYAEYSGDGGDGGDGDGGGGVGGRDLFRVCVQRGKAHECTDEMVQVVGLWLDEVLRPAGGGCGGRGGGGSGSGSGAGGGGKLPPPGAMDPTRWREMW